MLIDDVVKLNRSFRNAAYAALIVIAAIAMYGWMVAPHVNYLFAVQRYETTVDDVVKENKVINEALAHRKRRLHQLQQQFVELQSTLFAASEAKEFFSDLQAISEQAGCAIYSLNFVIVEPETRDQQLTHSSGIVADSAVLNIVGTYGNIIKLVERLQMRTQKVWVDSLEMVAFNDDATELECGITITIYAIQDKESALNE